MSYELPTQQTLSGAALQIQLQQFRQRLVGRDVFGPAIGRRHRAIELVMRVDEPLGALIVEIGQRALFQRRGGLGVLGQNAVGVARDDFRNDVDEVWRIEPTAPRSVEFARGFGDSPGAGIISVCFGCKVRRQSFGEGESFEAGLYHIGRPAAVVSVPVSRARCERPSVV